MFIRHIHLCSCTCDTIVLLLLLLFGLALGTKFPLDDHRVDMQRGNCSTFWYSFQGRCFRYFATQMTWADAELYCVSKGANLVSIHSHEEQNFVRHLIKNVDPSEGFAWIGLTDIQKRGAWMWSDGSAVDFVLWNIADTDPNNNEKQCIFSNYDIVFQWGGSPCLYSHAFVCASRKLCQQLG